MFNLSLGTDANAKAALALVGALIRHLSEKGLLAKPDVASVLDDAISELTAAPAGQKPKDLVEQLRRVLSG